MQIVIIAMLVAMLVAPAVADITLVKDGKSDYVIVTAPNPTPAEQRGASELQKYIQQMSGAELPIVANPKPIIRCGPTIR